MIKKKRQVATGMLPETKEKIFLIIFLIFAIAVIILLFKAPSTGKAVLGMQLDSQSYAIGDKIDGMANLEIQEGDSIPEKAQVQFFIQTNATKIPTEVCGKLVRNCGFGQGLIYWTPKAIAGGKVYLEENYAVDEDYESNVIITDTSDVTKEAYAAVKQTFKEIVFTPQAAFAAAQQGDIVVICTHEDPTVTVNNASQTGSPGKFLQYMVNVTNNDHGAGCTSSMFNFTFSNCPSGWTCSVSPAYRNIAPGTNALSFALRVTPSSTASPGSYNITVTATNSNFPQYKTDASATYIIGAGPSCSGTSSLSFNPSSATIGSNVKAAFTVSKYGSSTNCAGKVVKIYQGNSCTTGYKCNCTLPSESSSSGASTDTSTTTTTTYATYDTYSTSCQCSFTAPSTAGITNYTACMDGTAYKTSQLTVSGQAECTSGDVRTCGLAEGHKGLQQCKTDRTWSECMPFKLEWDAYFYGEEPCAFEIVLNGSDGNKLHYYYELSSATGCSMPSSTGTDKYVPKIMSMEEFVHQSEYIFDDWNWSVPANFSLKEMWLISHGNYINDVPYGQIVRWDNVDITTSVNEASQNCTVRGKKCCPIGSGFGNYYELDCSEGYECWSSCNSFYSNTLKWFIDKSEPNDRYNKTAAGLFTYMKPESEQFLGEFCGEDTGIGFPEDQCLAGGDEASSTNRGYAFCLNTSSNSCNTANCKCRDWDNAYEFALENIPKDNRKVPSENGTYDYFIRIVYTPESGYCGSYIEEETTKTLETCVLYESSTSFTVGEGGEAICTPKWVNCTNTTRCGAETNYAELNLTVCIDENNCNEACPSDVCKVWGVTGATCPPEMRSCIEDDYSCDSWTPALCKPNSKQTRTCELTVPGTCNDTAADAVTPSLEQTCSKESLVSYAEAQQAAGKSRKQVESSLKAAGWPSATVKEVLDEVYFQEGGPGISIWVWIIIAVILAGAVVLILMMRKKGGKAGKKAAPPELISYVRDALATGATKAEIAARLIQAGWPRDSVDAAMKALRL